MKALLIVDVQNDFLTGGSLAVKDAEDVIPVINKVMDKFDLVIASKDWHPSKTAHFEKWPVHCVADSKGAEFHPGLSDEKIKQIFYKGTGNKDDGYSAFEATNIELADFLREKEIRELYICGIALEFCVKSTALDALKEGLNVLLVKDAIATFSKEKEEVDKQYSEIVKAGAQVILSNQIN
jgi:nicotinamidase/pyrazinamidase